MNYEQYKILHYNESRSHSLEDFNLKIKPFRLEELITEIYEKNRLAGEKTRVMEIGVGNGRVLMELKKKFPDIEFYGINREKTHTLYRRESFLMTALKFGIMNEREMENMTLPYLIFADLDFGGRIPYDNAKFDLVFSQSVIPYIRYTFELFNEIMRILKSGGISIHSDVTGISIYQDGVLLGIKEAMKEIRKQGVEIYNLDNPNSIRFKKSEQSTNFPLTPHQPIPKNIESLSGEQRRPEMGYNLL
jgi:SAM-dependent methyltransferase